jgi:hypothetical protein
MLFPQRRLPMRREIGRDAEVMQVDYRLEAAGYRKKFGNFFKKLLELVSRRDDFFNGFT